MICQQQLQLTYFLKEPPSGMMITGDLTSTFTSVIYKKSKFRKLRTTHITNILILFKQFMRFIQALSGYNQGLPIGINSLKLGDKIRL